MNEYIHSPMNYTGGKYKLLPQILPLFPKKVDTFVDLFCGGLNVGVNVEANHYYFNDALAPVIEIYEMFKERSFDEIRGEINGRIEEFNLSKTNKDGYLQLREQYNSEPNPVDLFSLTCFAFNYMIRFNNKGGFNTAFGKDRSCFNPKLENNLERTIERLHSIDCHFSSVDFKDFDFDQLPRNSLIYCDPPYLAGSAADYNKVWNETTEKELLALLDELHEQGFYFALSNVLEHNGKRNEILAEWAQKYNVHHLNANYSNSYYARKDKQCKSDEVLITNYE